MSNIDVSPDDGDFCWNDLDLWLGNEGDDITLSTPEYSDTMGFLAVLAATYLEDPPPTRISVPRIRLNWTRLRQLADRIRANKGRLWAMMNAGHKAQAEALIDELLHAHPTQSGGP